MTQREIKFRAWDKKTKRIGQVLSLTLDFGLCDVFFGDPKETDTGRYLSEVDLLEFTGFKDKNDVEVYIADLWRDGMGDLYEVSWGWAGKNQDEFAECVVLTPIDHDGSIIQFSPNEAKEGEVVGSAYTKRKSSVPPSPQQDSTAQNN